MRKTYVVACFSLLIAAATIITQQESEVPIRAATVRERGLNPTALIPAASITEQPAAGKQLVMETYGRLPLSFEANHGQTDASVKFLSRGNGYTLFLTATEAVLALRKSEPRASASGGLNPSRDSNGAGHPQITPITPIVIPETVRSSPSVESAKSVDQESVLRMKLVGANPNAAATGDDELPGKSNYFLGNDPSKWRANVSTYAKVRYEDVYPGIDLVYYGEPAPAGRGQRQLEYDFVVAPGADPRAIRLAFPSRARLPRAESRGKQAVNPNGDPSTTLRAGREEAVPLRIDGQGDLVLETGDGSNLRLHKPLVYQETEGVRQQIAGNYALHSDGAVGITLAAYDASKPLVIDPVLVYSTYLGGSGDDFNSRIAVDGSGSVYVTGTTTSAASFPRVNAFQTGYNGRGDVFVTKFNAAGSALVYSKLLGGGGQDFSSAIAVDGSGNVYVTGQTDSLDFPTASPFQARINGFGGAVDAFVTKLNAAGSALVYSTYFGGMETDSGNAIAVDSSGSAYVAGSTSSLIFPTRNSFQLGGGGEDAFVTKFNPAGSALQYSTYLGGKGNDRGFAIAVDSSGNAYVTGATTSDNFRTASTLQTRLGGGVDAFVTVFNAAGSALVYSTYLGGSGDDFGSEIAVDGSGNAYVTGITNSTDFPTANAFQTAFGGGTCGAITSPVPCYDAFITNLNAAGSALVYSTYLGGNQDDFGNSIAVDSSGNAYVTGTTHSTNFPTAYAYQPLFGGGSCAILSLTFPCPDTFMTKFNAAGSALAYSTYWGGSSADGASGIARDPAGNVYITGVTASSNFPTESPFQSVFGGGFCGTGPNPFPCSDVFVVKISDIHPLPTVGSLSPLSAPAGTGTGNVIPFSLTVNGSNFVPESVVRWNGNNRATMFVSTSRLTATILASDMATAGTAQVTVFTPPPGGGLSSALTFTISAGTGGVGTAPAISSGGVLNNASYDLVSAAVPPGAIVAVFGSRLTDGTSCLPPSCNPAFGSNGRLNTAMAGAQVSVNGTPVPIFYAIPGQLGIQIPTELTGSSATVQVSVGGQSSPAATVQVEPVSPGIFSFTGDGRGAGAFTHADGSPVSPQNPARPGEVVILYATGLGQVSPAVATGALPGGESRTVSSATVTIDGISVIPDFAGLAGCCVGLNQINLRIPSNTRTANDMQVVLTVGGKQSNTVTIAVR